MRDSCKIIVLYLWLIPETRPDKTKESSRFRWQTLLPVIHVIQQVYVECGPYLRISFHLISSQQLLSRWTGDLKQAKLRIRGIVASQTQSPVLQSVLGNFRSFPSPSPSRTKAKNGSAQSFVLWLAGGSWIHHVQLNCLRSGREYLGPSAQYNNHPHLNNKK